jgi:hypothetical protein
MTSTAIAGESTLTSHRSAVEGRLRGGSGLVRLYRRDDGEGPGLGHGIVLGFGQGLELARADLAHVRRDGAIDRVPVARGEGARVLDYGAERVGLVRHIPRGGRVVAVEVHHDEGKDEREQRHRHRRHA